MQNKTTFQLGFITFSVSMWTAKSRRTIFMSTWSAKHRDSPMCWISRSGPINMIFPPIRWSRKSCLLLRSWTVKVHIKSSSIPTKAVTKNTWKTTSMGMTSGSVRSRKHRTLTVNGPSGNIPTRESSMAQKVGLTWMFSMATWANGRSTWNSTAQIAFQSEETWKNGLHDIASKAPKTLTYSLIDRCGQTTHRN